MDNSVPFKCGIVMDIFMTVLAVLIIGLQGLLFWHLRRSVDKLSQAPQSLPAPQVNVNLSQVENMIRELPNKTLQSIQSSVNTKKGALGELIGYTELRAEYDRIIPLGNIVDFMCIKFPKKDHEGVNDLGHVDFVDIKTGNRSRLSKDQRELQKLIKEKRIRFVKVKVETSASDEDNLI